MSSSTVVKCSRCGAADHVAVNCRKPFLREFCAFCNRPGHVAASCPQKRRAQAKEAREKQQVQMKTDYERKSSWCKRDVDSRSDVDEISSLASRSTSVSLPRAVVPSVALSELEEKEVKKTQKKLREIAKLEERSALGEKLDQLQLDKIQQKDELLSSFVMVKARARDSLSSAGA
eukprot:gnl/TRDRNA2_/TRDRNA2_178902_c0_seq1.p1 gnl/TRDRNA2_/TRDRNA2_178902_c0~~gnl/TRDRNA2_/TRDRNA2_178902_c0_seq1.p1  ORF type:complete len:199 (-),score=42.34 gnl/TRDRNA2_/TRDRNA2_178902_c0_seq1:128-652(-)